MSRKLMPHMDKSTRLLLSAKTMFPRDSTMAQCELEAKQVYKLLQEVHWQNKEKVVHLLCHGVPGLINLTEPKDGISALHVAALNNYLEMAHLLLSLKAHPDIQNKKGQSSIMMAAELGHVEMVELLASNEASMTLVDNEGKGILFYCISPTKMHEQIQEMIMKGKVNANNISFTGRSAFMFACEHAEDCENLCLQLLEKGANPNRADLVTGCTALMAATRSGSVPVMRAILQRGGNPNAVDKQQLSAAHIAAAKGFIEALMLLSAYSADFNWTSSLGDTPLHKAAAEGHEQCCRFLFQRGCNVMRKNYLNLLPSQVAKLNRCKAAMKELSDAEKALKSVNFIPFINQARLHDWSFENEAVLRLAFKSVERADSVMLAETFVSVLKDHHAPIDDDSLQTVVDAVAQKVWREINVDNFFLGHGFLPKQFQLSSFNYSSIRGTKGMAKVTEKVAEKVTDMILPKKLDSHTCPAMHEYILDPSSFFEPKDIYISVSDCVKMNDFASLHLAFSQNIPVDVRDCFYKTPLMVACICGNQQMVCFLISHGANVNCYDQLKWTSLHHACFGGYTNIVKRLLDHGAVVNAMTTNNVTPLMRAIESCNPSCVDLLIKSGANVMATNKRGQDCMMLARRYGNPQIQSLIKNALEEVQKAKPKAKAARPAKKKDTTKSKRMPEECKQAINVNVALNPDARNYCITTPSQTVWGERVVATAKLKQRMSERKVRFAEDMMKISNNNDNGRVRRRHQCFPEHP
ncbi:ankyrin repeat and EF-hand domain-containing protein 1-like [Silurus meridionalis]|uniref:Ankyrin repeat and EF-hand domain-containing protein 1 n=1 Tax=Silurus meridionalis TaxID=175797 RepID=A0A8T0BAL4_SILME|nr:ankyrin repeat and EF-hand domain-containing protein 1-like [Silurus meridionalis]XP_046712016.1 ankyrin repeat and EF-hand domain-containing protein 1-like [Silurus meridionalis]KAF7704071.1 hypothetical protein HF521_021143 [Silurus meridionalis]